MSCNAWVALICVVSVLFFAIVVLFFRRVKLVSSTKLGATAALKHVEEWAKWMSGILSLIHI